MFDCDCRVWPWGRRESFVGVFGGPEVLPGVAGDGAILSSNCCDSGGVRIVGVSDDLLVWEMLSEVDRVGVAGNE